MNEAQRQAYLKHCGVSFWYSKSPLPGAAPSIEFDYSVFQFGPGLAQSASLPKTPNSGEVEPPKGYAPKTISKAPAQQITPENPAPTALLGAVRAAPVPKSAIEQPLEKPVDPDRELIKAGATHSIAVNLRIAITEQLVVVAQVGEDLPGDMQEKLLLQIGIAAGHVFTLDTLTKLSWPVFANRAVPGNDDAGLNVVLLPQLKPLIGRAWLGLGPQVVELMSTLDETQRSAAPRLMFKHDLSMLATSGALKRALWDELRGSSILRTAS